MRLLLLLFALLLSAARSPAAAQAASYHVCSSLHGCCATVNGGCATLDGHMFSIFQDKWCNGIGVSSATPSGSVSACLMAALPNSTCYATYLAANLLGTSTPGLTFLVAPVAETAEYTVTNYGTRETCTTQKQACILGSGGIAIVADALNCYGQPLITWSYPSSPGYFVAGCLAKGADGWYQDMFAMFARTVESLTVC